MNQPEASREHTVPERTTQALRTFRFAGAASGPPQEGSRWICRIAVDLNRPETGFEVIATPTNGGSSELTTGGHTRGDGGTAVPSALLNRAAPPRAAGHVQVDLADRLGVHPRR
jgi:hypothetical protein